MAAWWLSAVAWTLLIYLWLLPAFEPARPAKPLTDWVRAHVPAGVELMADKATRTPFPAAAKAGALVEAKCHEAGLVVRAIGDRVAFCPPLISTEENLREMVSLFRQGLDAAYAELKGKHGLA